MEMRQPQLWRGASSAAIDRWIQQPGVDRLGDPAPVDVGSRLGGPSSGRRGAQTVNRALEKSDCPPLHGGC